MLKINKKLSKSGFSLIELMVAVVILAMAIFGIFQAYSVGFMGMADSRDRTVATNYAREAMEDIKNMDFEEIITQERTAINGNTKYEREVIVQPSINLKRVTSKVYWKDRKGTWKIVDTEMVIHFIETTAGTPSKIILYAEPYNILTDDDGSTDDIYEDESIITAIVKDNKGNTITTWDKDIDFGLVDTGSGNLSSTTVTPDNFVNGKVVITFTSGTISEEVTITASSAGLTSDSVIIGITDPDEPVKINLTADIYFMTPSISSTSLITAEIFDAGNALVTSATNEIAFSVTGPGTLSSPTTMPADEGEAEITLTSNGTPGTITVTASSSGLVPDFVTIITGGKINLFSSDSSVAVNAKIVIGITTKDLYGFLINYDGTINLSMAGYGDTPGDGDLDPDAYVTFTGDTYLETVDFTASSEGKVKITATDPLGILDPAELILTITPVLIPHHIDVSAEPSSIEVGGNISDITALMKTSPETGNVTVTSYEESVSFTTTTGSFTYFDFEFANGVAEAVLSSSSTAGTATVEVSSGDFTGTTDVGFYFGVDHIDLIANPQNILSGGGSEGTCTITATIKEGINVVTGYDGDITFFIETGHPSGVVFVTTNKSSVTMKVVNGKAEIDLISKNWTGIARIKATIFYGAEEITEYLNIPVVANKNLEIFMLYKNESTNFLKYYYPEDGLPKGSWVPGPVTYGKFCVDSDNNLYILDGNYIQKKSNSGILIETSEAITGESYAINIGPDGYIYFTQNTGTTESPDYCVKKINPNTLVVEDILHLNNYTYYGLAIDSDGSIYIHNYTEQKIEKWQFESGFITSKVLGANYNLSELAIAGDHIGGIGKNGNTFEILKTLTETENPFTLTNIPNLLYISSIGGDLLFCGLYEINEIVEIVFERYNIIQESIEWSQFIIDNVYSDCIIGAYPF